MSRSSSVPALPAACFFTAKSSSSPLHKNCISKSLVFTEDQEEKLHKIRLATSLITTVVPIVQHDDNVVLL